MRCGHENPREGCGNRIRYRFIGYDVFRFSRTPVNESNASRCSTSSALFIRNASTAEAPAPRHAAPRRAIHGGASASAKGGIISLYVCCRARRFYGARCDSVTIPYRPRIRFTLHLPPSRKLRYTPYPLALSSLASPRRDLFARDFGDERPPLCLRSCCLRYHLDLSYCVCYFGGDLCTYVCTFGGSLRVRCFKGVLWY